MMKTKMKGRILAILMSLAMVFVMMPMFGQAVYADGYTSGSCGDNVSWTLEGTTLTISGTGAMRDYYLESSAPWYDDRFDIKTILITGGVTSIGKYAFSQCISLTSVTIPNSVESIGVYAFENCNSLTSITIPDSVTSIGTGAFAACYSLTSITIPKNVTSIEDDLFYLCSSLTSITIPNKVTSIGHRVFRSCSSLTSITIPSGVTSIGIGAFEHCSSLTSITIPSGVTSIGTDAFEGCSSLTSITIPSGVTSIEDDLFYLCSSLESITIPDGVTIIKKSAFRSCSSLSNVTIPDSVTSIGNNAFEGCQIINMHYNGSKAQWKNVTTGDGWDASWPTSYNTCDVTITSGDNMTASSTEDLIQVVTYGSEMTSVVFTAVDGYYFPADYPVDTVKGVSVIRDSDSQITVSGTPTADVEITLPAATKKPTLTITVKDQTYTYNGKQQGPGDAAYEDAAQIAEVIIVDGLQGGDTITSVILDGQATEIGTHKDVLKVTGFTINKNDPEAKDRYAITLVPGTITIEPAYTPDPYITIPATEEHGITVRALIKDGVASIADISVAEINQAAAGNIAIIDLSKVTVDGKTAEIKEIELTKSTISNFVSSDATGVEVRLSTGSAVVDKASLEAIASEAAGGTVSLYIATSTDAEKTMTDAQKAVIEGMEGALAVEVKISSGGKAISAPLTIKVPFETEKLVRAWYVAEDGTKEATECTHDGKVAELTLTHCSHYVLEQYELLENPLSVKGKTVTVKYSKLKKKAQTLKASKLYKFTNKGKGTKTYTLSSAKKAKKSFKKYFTVDKKAGKIKVKKGLKKGTYTVKVKVKAAGSGDYKLATKTVTIKVKVK